MLHLNGQGFHVASGRSILSHTIGGSFVQAANVDMRNNISMEDVLLATNDEMAGMDPLDILIRAQEEHAYPRDFVPPCRAVIKRKGKNFPVSGRNDESGIVAINLVLLVAPNTRRRHLREEGTFPVKHQVFFEGIRVT